MTTSLGYFVLFVIVYAYWKKQHREVARVEFCSAIFALRDKTRRLAIDKKIDADNWAFQYFDLSFSKTVKHSSQLSLAAILATAIFRKKDSGFSDFRSKLKSELDQTPELKKINDQYIKIVVNFLFAQELIPRGVLPRMAMPFKFLKERYRSYIKNLNSNTEFTVADRFAV
jgi:hypothetical protein